MAINASLLNMGTLGTPACPAPRLRAAIRNAQDDEAMLAAVDAYETYLRAEMAIVDAAMGTPFTTEGMHAVLSTRAQAIANSTQPPRQAA